MFADMALEPDVALRNKKIDDQDVYDWYLIWLCISKREYWFFDDSAAFRGTDTEMLAKFRQVRRQIEARVKAWIANSQ